MEEVRKGTQITWGKIPRNLRLVFPRPMLPRPWRDSAPWTRVSSRGFPL